MPDDLLQFPDGGRATLTRRYSPTLTKRQLDVLAECPYGSPRAVANRDYRTARVLTRWGLLEQDPTRVASFQVTEAGAQIVLLWKMAGFLP